MRKRRSKSGDVQETVFKWTDGGLSKKAACWMTREQFKRRGMLVALVWYERCLQAGEQRVAEHVGVRQRCSTLLSLQHGRSKAAMESSCSLTSAHGTPSVRPLPQGGVPHHHRHQPCLHLCRGAAARQGGVLSLATEHATTN
eukprot:1160325-Pelagomonas_calceolata.AAC.19